MSLEGMRAAQARIEEQTIGTLEHDQAVRERDILVVGNAQALIGLIAIGDKLAKAQRRVLDNFQAASKDGTVRTAETLLAEWWAEREELGND
jgi:hypothetical protein